jgi:hypothetical protein
MTLGDIATLSDRRFGDARTVFFQVRTAMLNQRLDHQAPDSGLFATVRRCSLCGLPAQTHVCDLLRTPADGWGVKGHRVKG